jgi:superfamily I DNA/RNA helicase/RecB family exonuclease
VVSPPLLVRPATAHRPRARWDDAARRVLAGPDGFLRVLGGPGTGKTTLLVAAAAERIAAGADPESVLVLTGTRRSAADVRAEITRLLTGANDDPEVPRTVREPMVRTVHSYAFGVLRLQANAQGGPPPRLLTAADRDAWIRDLLAGDVEDGFRAWPERLQPALLVPGFAEELGDLVLRAAERGLGPEDLIRLGREHHRDEWLATGRFWLQYEQVNLLRGASDAATMQAVAPPLDAAELVDSALLAFDSDPPLLRRERGRIRHLFVDDAQHLDPLQYALIRLLGAATDEFVLAGDPDQTVFAFRGAESRLLADADPDGTRTVVLTAGHRMLPAIGDAVRRLTARLPGAGVQRHLDDPDPVAEQGTVLVRLWPTPAAEAAWIADQLRRAHLLDEVPWSEMAVLVRSPNREVSVLHRALAAAGVPVAVTDDDLPLAAQTAVRPFLTLLRCADRPATFDAEQAAVLLASPLGGADPLALRRLRRGLRRLEQTAGGDRSSDELLLHVLEDDDLLTALDDGEAAPVRRIAHLLAVARKAIADDASVEQVLWQVWQESGLEARWTALARRGGPVGARADRDLDNIVALFHAAEHHVDRQPAATPGAFADYLAAQRIAADSLAPSAPLGDAVSILTAHASAGREWTVVAIAGVQEGAWPDLRLRGSLLGVERMVDTLSGIPTDMTSQTAPLLAEERRLLMVAVSRARRRLLVSAIQGDDEQPSRFLDELDEDDREDDKPRPVQRPGRGLTLAELVGELRRAVCSPTADEDTKQRAARQLARLADAGVPGAHPAAWYGLPEVSSESPLWTDEDTVAVTPSTIEKLLTCPLRWLVERTGGNDPAELPAITGNLVHALAEAVAAGADDEAWRAALDRAWSEVDAGAPWFSRRERARLERMIELFRQWLEASRDELTELAVEYGVSVKPPTPEVGGGPEVVVRGRVDRVEVDKEGRPVIVDIKTGKNAVTKEAAAEHPQLAVYQLAAALGAFSALGARDEPGGAHLLYVGKEAYGKATERSQQPLDADGLRAWLGAVQQAAQACAGPEYTARQNADCDRCPVRTACPNHESGRQV